MPNPIAYLSLFAWPLIMVFLFKRLPADRALIWSMLGAFMFVAEKAYLDLPVVPTLNKYTLPSLTAVALGLFMLKQRFSFFPASRVALALLIGLALAPFGTAFTNTEPVFWGRLGLPSLTLKDGLGDMMRLGIIALPFLLGYNYLGTPQARSAFVRIFMICGLIYSVPMLLETRLTPQFSYWFYGYFPDLFGQQVRFGGFRPVVFMGHGLIVAVFAMLAAASAAILLRGAEKPRSQYVIILMYLIIVLVFCRTLGALVLGMAIIPLILFTGTRLKGWVILICALFTLCYPILRANDLIPTEQLVGYARMVQEDRAGSLEYRFNNEQILLDRASEKPVFGWGSYLRNRVFDPESGRDITTTDGHWIIVIGTLGWVGYICTFGLLTLPLIRLWAMRKRGAEFPDAPILYGIALMLAVNLVDLIPNSSIRPVTWLMAGMLLAARPETRGDETNAAEETPVPEAAPHIRQKRDGLMPEKRAKNRDTKPNAQPEFTRKKR